MHTPESGGSQRPAVDHTEWWTEESRGEGQFGHGWRFGPAVQFGLWRLHAVLCRNPWNRLKGVLATSASWVSINRVAGIGDIERHPDAAEGRLEIIHHRPLDGAALDRRLLAARLSVDP